MQRNELRKRPREPKSVVSAGRLFHNFTTRQAKHPSSFCLWLLLRSQFLPDYDEILHRRLRPKNYDRGRQWSKSDDPQFYTSNALSVEGSKTRPVSRPIVEVDSLNVAPRRQLDAQRLQNTVTAISPTNTPFTR